MAAALLRFTRCIGPAHRGHFHSRAIEAIDLCRTEHGPELIGHGWAWQARGSAYAWFAAMRADVCPVICPVERRHACHLWRAMGFGRPDRPPRWTGSCRVAGKATIPYFPSPTATASCMTAWRGPCSAIWATMPAMLASTGAMAPGCMTLATVASPCWNRRGRVTAPVASRSASRARAAARWPIGCGNAWPSATVSSATPISNPPAPAPWPARSGPGTSAGGRLRQTWPGSLHLLCLGG